MRVYSKPSLVCAWDVRKESVILNHIFVERRSRPQILLLEHQRNLGHMITLVFLKKKSTKRLGLGIESQKESLHTLRIKEAIHASNIKWCMMGKCK